MFADVSLDKQGAAFGVDAASDEVGGEGEDPLAEVCGVVVDCDGVGVDDTEEEVFVSVGHLLGPGSDGAEVVAYVEFTRRLNS